MSTGGGPYADRSRSKSAESRANDKQKPDRRAIWRGPRGAGVASDMGATRSLWFDGVPHG
jgi:hypothetical protein